MAVRYYEQDVRSKLQDKRKLAAFISKLVNRHRRKLEGIDLQYIFCNDEYLLSINQQFLQHDDFTDIITFDLTENEKDLVAEIYISVERVMENAEKFKEPYLQELHRVIFHGALHLCGFKDKTAARKKEMKEQENACLQAYFKK